MPVNDINDFMAKNFAESGMFYRCKQVQAFVKIQAVKKLITTICA
jgi:hypothetical protein